MSILDMMDDVAKHLRSYRFRWHNETSLQKAVHLALQSGPWKVDREHRLSESDRVDFHLTSADGLRLAVELKVQGDMESVQRQVARYAASTKVDGVLLVSTSNRLAMGLADTAIDKPVRSVVLSGGLL